jgi:hypothetical protein
MIQEVIGNEESGRCCIPSRTALHSGFAAAVRLDAWNRFQLQRSDGRDALGPAHVQHVGVNTSVGHATRVGAADARISFLSLPRDPFRTSRCTSLMLLPSDMADLYQSPLTSHLSPLTSHLSLPQSRATILRLPTNRYRQATRGNGVTISLGRYPHRETRTAIVLPNLNLDPENSR